MIFSSLNDLELDRMLDRMLLKELTFDWEEVPSFVIIGIYMAIHMVYMGILSRDYVT